MGKYSFLCLKHLEIFVRVTINLGWKPSVLHLKFEPVTLTIPDWESSLAPNLIANIRAIAQELHAYRSTQMERKQWGITKLYNEYFHEPTSQLFKLHAKLDQLVMQAYGFKPADDLLEKLLTLNLELAEKEKRGEAIVGPWAPTQ